jgi:peroxiredoxin
MTKVTVQDCNAIGFCMKSVRPWFAQHDLDFKDFVKNGIDERILIKTNDAFAVRAVAQARKREAADGS